MIQTSQHMIAKYLNATFYSVTKDHVSSSKYYVQPGLSVSLQYILKCCYNNLCHSGTLHEMVSKTRHYRIAGNFVAIKFQIFQSIQFSNKYFQKWINFCINIV